MKTIAQTHLFDDKRDPSTVGKKGGKSTVVDYALAPFFSKKLLSKKDTKALRKILEQLALFPGVDIRKMSMVFEGPEEVTLEQVLSDTKFIKSMKRRSAEAGVILGLVTRIHSYYMKRRRVNQIRKDYWNKNNGK